MNIETRKSILEDILEPLPTARVRPGGVGRLVLAPFMMATLLAATVGYAQKDDFDDKNDNGWTQYDPIRSAIGFPVATFSFPNGGYRIETVRSPAPAQVGPSRAGSVR